MRHRKIILGLLALVVVGILAAALWPEKSEPVYKGKKLSEWLVSTNSMGVQPEEARLALQSIGTNGIPYYLEWIRYKPSIARRAQFRLADYAHRWLGSQWVPVDRKVDRARGAAHALIMLGERAELAIPQYVAFITNNPALSHSNPPSLDDAMSGYLLLAQIGAPSVPAFLSLMTNQDPRIRATAVAYSMQNYDTSLVAQVRISLRDSDHRVRLAATNVMRTYDPDFGLPVHKP
jgi:hypothetical protein